MIIDQESLTLQDFCTLIKEGYIRNLRQGDFFALEGFTKMDDQLNILMSGRLSVKSENVLLHTIHPYEFVNSVEWEAMKTESSEIDRRYSVIGRLFNNGPTYQVQSSLNTLLVPRNTEGYGRLEFKRFFFHSTGHDGGSNTLSHAGHFNKRPKV